MWININDKQPNHGQDVLVKIKCKGDYYAIAQYSKDYGFSADDSGYNISCDDDSGMQIDLRGSVEYWMDIPIMEKK